MISFQQIQYLLALNDFGQFQKASEACFVTQPTLSMQVKKAEELLGHQIFKRSSSPLTLTAFGEQLIPVLRDVMTENTRIDQLVQRTNGTFVEKIRVGVIPTIASYLVPTLFQNEEVNSLEAVFSFKEMHTHHLIEQLNNGKLDVIILAGPYQQPGMQSVKLFEEEIKVYLHGNHAKEINSDDLKDNKPWLLTEGNCLRTQMISFCEIRANENQNQWDYEGGNLELLVRMVDAQGGYTLVPENYFSASMNSISLSSVRISDNGRFPSRTIIGVFPNRSIFRSNIDRMLRQIQRDFNKPADRLYESIGWQGD